MLHRCYDGVQILLHYNVLPNAYNIASCHRRHIAKLISAAIAAIVLVVGAPALAAPKVVASLMPIHSLVAGVMGDLGTPALLVRGYGSPHAYAMPPSDAALLSNADLVFWVGETMETFLQRPLAALARKARIVSLIDTQGLVLLPNRPAGVWDAGGDSGRADAVVSPGRASTDPHIWLDPGNAKLLAQEIARRLSELDPASTAVYRRNAQDVSRRIDALDRKLGQQLRPVRTMPYALFHDGFQYFERRYGLRAVGSLTLSPDRVPGARRLRELRAKIKELDVRCVFSEPQFESALLKTVIGGTSARRSVLDPLGAGLRPGPDAYFEMMNANASAIVDCLSETKDARSRK
jgi:zinc transport system substrate-binding protein